jgi:hypothetical protein
MPSNSPAFVSPPSASTRVGVGSSKAFDAFRAGREAAETAVRGLDGELPTFALVFATTGYEPSVLLAGINEVLGETPWSGCAGEGLITQGRADESGHAVAVMAFASREMTFTPIHVRDGSADPSAAADSLAAAVDRLRRPDEDAFLLLFPDGVQVNCGAFLERLDARLALPIAIAGGASGGILDTLRTFQYHCGEAFTNSIAAVLVQGRFVAEVAVNHGCEPIGLERTITSASGGYVHEIDGRPALEVFKEYLDADQEEIGAADLVHLCLGQVLSPERRDGYGQHLIGMPSIVDHATGSIFFPTGFTAGTTVQLTRRDPELVRDGAVESCRTIRERHPHENPLFVLQFDCCGRGRVLFADAATAMTVDPLQAELGREVPWLGFHTFGELAQLGAKTYYHNYTVVVCAFYSR